MNDPKTDHPWLECGCHACRKIRQDRAAGSAPRLWRMRRYEGTDGMAGL